MGPLSCAKFHLNRHRGVRMRLTNIKNFHFFGNESPRRGDSLDRFRKFLRAFIRLTILRQCFKFHMIRITGYGVIAETARHSIRPNFSVHPVWKTIRWIKNRWQLFDGFDELYHRVKFGEDRTMRAGHRCENVVFVFFLCNQCRLIQWARRARAQGPQASGGPQTADALDNRL